MSLDERHTEFFWLFNTFRCICWDMCAVISSPGSYCQQVSLACQKIKKGVKTASLISYLYAKLTILRMYLYIYTNMNNVLSVSLKCWWTQQYISKCWAPPFRLLGGNIFFFSPQSIQSFSCTTGVQSCRAGSHLKSGEQSACSIRAPLRSLRRQRSKGPNQCIVGWPG